MALPAPKVPALQEGNWIDLEQLGSDDLLTWIDYPGIALGQEVFPNWRGCGADGTPRDLLLSSRPIESLPPEGFALRIPNPLMRELEQGWVFYSYFIPDLVQPDLPGEESLRRFFYVGQPDLPAVMPGLGVPQLHESHQLSVVLDWIVGNSATVLVPPYRAMVAGDQVTLTLALYFGADDPFEEKVLRKTLTAQDVGLPLSWSLPSAELEIIEDGYLEAHYQIDYASPTVSSKSPTQRLDVRRSGGPRLPALRIEGFDGGALDPEQFPEGARLLIEPYPDMQVGDDVLLLAAAEQQRLDSLRVDPSVLDSGVLAFSLPAAWLAAHNGQVVHLAWQYARPGACGSGEALEVALRKPLHLPAPIVESAQPEDPVDGVPRGYLFPTQITGGAYVKVPEEAVIGPNDECQLHWEGHGSSGNVVIRQPTPADPLRFHVPPAAVPGNIGKRLAVYYQVIPAGESPARSQHFDLEIRALATHWPTIQLRVPTQSRPLSLADVPSSGALFVLPDWVFMTTGQQVHIEVRGVGTDGSPQTCVLRDALPVSEEEYYAGELSATLARAFLERLKIGSQFDVRVRSSFDDGESFIAFVTATIQLAA